MNPHSHPPEPLGHTGRGAWTHAQVEQVAPGVHRLPLPLPMDGLRAINVYALETDEGLVCIDAGWAVAESREVFERLLKEIGYGLGDITRFLVTHVHRDHYTQAVTVRRELGRATIDLGLGEKPTLDLFNSGDLTLDPTVARLRLAGAFEVAQRWEAMFEGADPDFGVWEFPDRWLEGEQLIEVGDRVLRAVPTPGHTAGHVVFADEAAGLLFAGDHVLPTITPSVGFELVFVGNPLGEFLGSLETVRALPDLRLMPAHGPVGMSSHERAGELLEHHDHRLVLCAAAIGTGATAYEVASRLTWTRHERTLDELDVFNTAMAAMETLVHLDLLVARGLLVREVLDGTAWFRLV